MVSPVLPKIFGPKPHTPHANYTRNRHLLKKFIPNLPQKLPEVHRRVCPPHDLSDINNYGQLVVVAGWGDGSLIEDITKSGLKKFIIAIIYQEEMRDFIGSLGRDLFPQAEAGCLLIPVLAENDDSLSTGVSAVFSNQSLIPHMGGMVIYDQHRLNEKAKARRNASMPRILHELEDKMAQPGNDPWDSLHGLQNCIRNYPNLLRRTNHMQLKAIFGKSPVICVGSGPSVGLCVDQLRDCQRSAYILAAESALPALLKNDITPDIVVTKERGQRSQPFCDSAKGTSCWWAGLPVTPPEIIDKFDDRLITVFGAGPMTLWVDPLGKIPPMNVGNTAGMLSLSLGSWMSEGAIYLIGHDLAHADDGATHWSAVGKGQSPLDGYVDGEDPLIEGNNGEMLKTKKTWSKLRVQLGTLSHARERYWGLQRVINVGAALKVGAKIPHTVAGMLPYNGTPIQKISLASIPPQDMATLSTFQERVPCLLPDVDEAIKTLSKSEQDVQQYVFEFARNGFTDTLQNSILQMMTCRFDLPSRWPLNYILHPFLYSHAIGLTYRLSQTKIRAQANAEVLRTVVTYCDDATAILHNIRPELKKTIDALEASA